MIIIFIYRLHLFCFEERTKWSTLLKMNNVCQYLNQPNHRVDRHITLLLSMESTSVVKRKKKKEEVEEE